MTNEELAVLAVQGDTESQHKLYFAVAPLIYKLTSRYFRVCGESKRGVRPEDLVQCGYFVYLDALKQFTPEKGLKFTTYLQFQVQNTCRSELGFRGKKEVETISLETPVGGEEELTLESAIADPDAEADITEYAEYNEMQLIVRQEVDRLPPKNQIVIYGLFWEEKTWEQICEEQRWERPRFYKNKHEAYHKLYSSEVLQRLAETYAGLDEERRVTKRQFSKRFKDEAVVTWNRDRISYLDKETVADLLKDSELTPIGGNTIWD